MKYFQVVRVPRGAGDGGNHGHEPPIDIFHAIKHLTDTITALPKDLARHFTPLKEVDGKIFAPKEAHFQLVNSAFNTNPQSPDLSMTPRVAPQA